MNAASWTIREATDADAEAITEVVLEAGVAAWGSFLGEERIRRANEGRRHPADLVAEDAEGVFGMVAWDVGTGEIQRLYVHPRGWGNGAARELLRRALDALRHAGHTEAWLNTEERNARAVAFYEREGWRRNGPDRVRTWNGAQLREPRFTFQLS